MFEEYIANDYLRFVALLVSSFIVLRLFVFILRKGILKITLKTKTKLDDLIVSKIKNPLTLMVLFFGILISIKELPLSETFFEIINKIVYSFLFLVLFYLGYNFIKIFIEHGTQKYSGRIKARKNAASVHLATSIVKVIFIISFLLLILSFLGVEIAPLLAGLGIGGIALAFALQNSLGNVFSGISIILDKSVEVGDLIQLQNGNTGKILKMGLRSTKLKTFDNEILIVPNSKLAEEIIHNVAMPEPKSRAVIPFSVAYGSDIEKVKKIVLVEIKTITGFVNDPEPSVKFLEMANSSLNFKAYFFVDSFENRFNAIDEANTKIYNALNKAKIGIPFPQMDVHIKKD